MGKKKPIQSEASNGCDESGMLTANAEMEKKLPKTSVWNVKKWRQNSMCHVNVYTSEQWKDKMS